MLDLEGYHLSKQVNASGDQNPCQRLWHGILISGDRGFSLVKSVIGAGSSSEELTNRLWCDV